MEAVRRLGQQEQRQALAPRLDLVVGDAVVVGQGWRDAGAGRHVGDRAVPDHFAGHRVARLLSGRVERGRVEPALRQSAEQGVADSRRPRGLQVEVRLVDDGVPQARRVLQRCESFRLPAQDVFDLRAGGVAGWQLIQEVGAGGHAPAVAAQPEGARHVAVLALVPAVVEEAGLRVLQVLGVEQELLDGQFGVAGVARDAPEPAEEWRGDEKCVDPELICVVVHGAAGGAGGVVQLERGHLLRGSQVFFLSRLFVEHEGGDARRGVVRMLHRRQSARDEGVDPAFDEVEVALVAGRLPGAQHAVHGDATVPVPVFELHLHGAVGNVGNSGVGLLNGLLVCWVVDRACCRHSGLTGVRQQGQQHDARKHQQSCYISRLVHELSLASITSLFNLDDSLSWASIVHFSRSPAGTSGAFRSWASRQTTNWFAPNSNV
ncbi:MAG: hypothetical protein MAG451_00350 [Anaerolineales bacterium]|nr:hypothetical protein [Anaerolineales bacterium]